MTANPQEVHQTDALTIEPPPASRQDQPDRTVQPLGTDFADALAELATSVLGSTEVGPEFDALLRAVEWLRAPLNHPKARILIGDFTRGY